MVLDVLIVIILVLFVARSIRGGMDGELFGTMGWLTAIVISMAMTDPVAEILASSFPEVAEVSPYLSFIVLLTLVRLFIRWLVKLVPEEKKGPFSILLRLASAGLGFFKGLFFTSVLFLVLTRTPVQANIEQYTTDSRLYSNVKQFSVQVVHVVTENVPNIEALMERISERRPPKA